MQKKAIDNKPLNRYLTHNSCLQKVSQQKHKKKHAKVINK